MKKYLALLLLATSAFAASTYTTNYNLEKPQDGSTSWGGAIRNDLDSIDTQMGINATGLANHIADTVGAHDATAIATNGGSSLCTTATTVEAYLDCLDSNVGPVLLGGSVTIAGAQTITGAKTFSSLITGTSGLNITAGTITLGPLSTGVVHSNSTGVLSSSNVVDADVDSAAAIARTKLASGTASHVLINNGSGVMSSEAQLAPSRGGSGVNNTGTLTWGTNNISITTSGSTSLTVPTSGTVATLAGGETLTNKVLSGNTATTLINGSGTLSLNSSGTVTVPNATDTLVGKATSDTLTNKVLTGNTAVNLISGSGTLTLNTSGTATIPNATDTLVGKNTTDTLTNKTISRASNTLSGYTANAVVTADSSGNASAGVVPSTSGNVLTSNGTSWVSSTPASAPDQSYELSNLSLASSVSSNALTIALKDKAGSDPSGGSPVKIGFRSSTSATGTYNQRSVTGALSLVISSGSTLGHASGVTHYIYVYALDNSGTVELAASTVVFPEGSVQSTTAEGGAGAADSNAVLYSATARTGVPIRLIGRLKVSETTAGTWASNASEVSLWPFRIQKIHAYFYNDTGNNTLTSGTLGSIDFANRTEDTLNAVSGTGGGFNGGWKFTAPATMLCNVSAAIDISASWSAGNEFYGVLRVNGSSVYRSWYTNVDRTANITRSAFVNVNRKLNTGDYIDFAAVQTTGSNQTTRSDSLSNWIEISCDYQI